MTKIQNPKHLEIEKMEFVICLEFGIWKLEIPPERSEVRLGCNK
jgi:hypothetical protein